MRGIFYRALFALWALLLFSCASAPYRTSLQLNPEPGKPSLTQQDLDYAYNTAVSTGVDLGYRVVSSSVEQRIVTLNRLRSADLVSETMEVSVESKGPVGNVSIVYQSPKPLEGVTVKEFTDRFLAKLRARLSIQPVGPAPSGPGSVRVEPDARRLGAEQQGETHLILLKNSNIRTEPSLKGKVITTVRKGEKVIKLDESGDWFNVGLPSGGTGWISKRLVKEVE